MRWLKSSEEGTVAAVVAVMLLVLLGMAALVIDIGDGYWERRMLQNSADAAALAVAGDCVQGDCGAFTATADSYATANNRRGAYVTSVTGPEGGAPTPAGGQVTVETATGDSASPGQLQMFFAGALGREEGLSAAARATAAWSATSTGKTIPLTLSQCEWIDLTGGDPSSLPTEEEYIYFADPGGVNLCDGPAGLDSPGGFGWLDVITDVADEDAGQCIARVELGEMDGETGNTAPKPTGSTGCSAAFFQDLVGPPPTTVLMPIHADEISGTGANTVYTIIGFAGLEITGFKLGGPPEWRFPAGFSCPEGPPATNCIRARLVDYWDVGSQPGAGGTQFGSTTFGLID